MVKRRDKDLFSTMCGMGCGYGLEDDYHIFVECPAFSTMRTESGCGLARRIARTISVAKIEDAPFSSLLEAAEYFYSDSCGLWPLKMSQYFYGQVPELSNAVPLDLFASPLERRRFIYKLFIDWHISSIRLVGRIWGEFARRTAKVFSNKSVG